MRQGYAVYVIDQPGRGRAAYQADAYGPLAPPDIENVQRRFVAPERYNLWPQARLHTQWPGQGKPGDPVFDQFYASQLPSIPAANATIFNRDAIVALLEKIGPAIVMTHSQSGAFGWPVADMRPDLVKAIVALEPGWITNRQIEASRVAMTRHIKRGGKVWITIFPDKPVTKKPAETRMGSGKGNPEGWVAVVKPGRVMFELSGVNEPLAREAMLRAQHKLPIRTKFITRVGE